MAQLLSNLPIGSKVKFGKHSINGETAQPITWLVVAKNHSSTPAYPSDSVTLFTEKIIDVRAFDAKEPSNGAEYVRQNGYNVYSVSNIDQWLNKDSPAGEWYTAQHSTDMPPSEGSVTERTYYTHRPGFLNAFSEVEKSSILTTRFRVAPSFQSSVFEEISRRVYLASGGEVGASSEDGGSLWEYFRTKPYTATLTKQVIDNISPGQVTSDETATVGYWLRSGVNHAGTVRVASSVSGDVKVANLGTLGVRPALNLSSSLKVSDATDGDGCYTFVWNTAPFKPASITTPTIYGGKANNISWGEAVDSEGDPITYQLECSVDDGSYVQIYSGTALSFAHLVEYGTSTVGYRVRAIDPLGEGSEYTTSATLTVVNNSAPVISGEDTNLGVMTDDFTGTYTITDANSDIVTVTEAIDGVQIRALVTTLGETITYGVNGNTWLALPNGSHTLTISATDGIDTTVRTIVFTKLVDKFSIQNSNPWVSSTMPTRIMIVVTRVTPATSKFKVEVCNNGYDASPKWEDATDAVVSGLVHVFSNKTKTATDWGVLIRVTVERNGATGACYISAIGGNFE